MAKKRPVTTWSRRLKAMRKARDLSQSEAAQLASVPLRTWIGWENSYRTPRGLSAKYLAIKFPELQDLLEE